MKSKKITGIFLGLLLVFSTGVNAYDNLLIIAPEAFVAELRPLVRFKNCSVRSTILISLNEVANTFSGVDLPEQVKYCIMHYQKTRGINSVMLIGDCDQFPVRYVCRDVGVPKGYQAGDLYYADLYKANGQFDNWDGNNNGLYGQFDGKSAQSNVDKVNWYPDVAFARVPASTVTELSTYIKKVIHYEVNASNAPWFKKALLATGDWDQDIKTKDHIASHYLSGFTVIKHYHTTVWQQYPIDPNDVAGSMDKRAAPMTAYINQGIGFLNHYGHGSNVDFCYVYDSRHLNDLTNTQKLPVVFSCGCGTAEFAPAPPWQDYYDINDKFHGGHAPGSTESVPKPKPIQPGQSAPTGIFNCDREARPEDWLVNRETGAIAYVGSAGTANPGYPPDLDKEFFKGFNDFGITSFGQLWKYVLKQYLGLRFDAQGNAKHSEEWHRHATWNALIRFTPFGDPSLIIGGAYTRTLSGQVSNNQGGPLSGHARYQITGDVLIPAGKTLSADSSVSVLFKNGKKMTTSAAGSASLVLLNGSNHRPIYLIALGNNLKAEDFIRGMKVNCQVHCQNGGGIKLY